MKKIYEAANAMEAQMLKDMLESAGLPVVVQGEYLGGAVGELPVNTYPTLWLEDERDEAAALAILRDWEGGNRHQMFDSDWTCPACGERLQAQFTQCWHCGHVRRRESQ